MNKGAIMNDDRKTPKVSVCVVTYNHENYIRKCLQSILDQETDFAFEIIVGEDGSSDGTKAIVQEFVDRHPDRIRAIFHEKNIGPYQNYLSVHKEAKGEYVAQVDGDDYCLPGKLQRLAAHLDREPGCAIVWHRMYIINEHGQAAVGMPLVPLREYIDSDRLYLKDLAKYYGITGCHSGSMYRASFRKSRTVNEDAPPIDYFFTLSFCAEGGYASYIDEPFGVYRMFSYENTMTRPPGKVYVGKAIISMMKNLLVSNPELAKPFATQCAFEILTRTYLRYPLKWDYFKMLLSCRAAPSLTDLALVIRVFLANRNASLQRAFAHAGIRAADL